MGSTIGLREILKASFQIKRFIVLVIIESDYLSFLGEEDEIDDSVYQDALVIIVDATKERIFDNRYELGKITIKLTIIFQLMIMPILIMYGLIYQQHVR